jgi:hypothetical protein
MRGHRFNGYYMKTWGFQLRRFADRKQLPRWLHRARSADIVVDASPSGDSQPVTQYNAASHEPKESK